MHSLNIKNKSLSPGSFSFTERELDAQHPLNAFFENY